MSWLILAFVVTANIICLTGEYLHLLGSGLRGIFEKYFREYGKYFWGQQEKLQYFSVLITLITRRIARPSKIFDKEKRYFRQFEKCLAKEYFSFLWSSRHGEKEEIRPLVSAFLFPHDLHFHIFLEMSQMKTKHLPTFRKKSENRPIFSQILTI